MWLRSAMYWVPDGYRVPGLCDVAKKFRAAELLVWVCVIGDDSLYAEAEVNKPPLASPFLDLILRPIPRLMCSRSFPHHSREVSHRFTRGREASGPPYVCEVG